MKMKKIFWLLFLLTSPAFATTYHVAKTGNDITGNGSSGTPWLTIGKCTSTATTGDTCTIHVGTYSENVVIRASQTVNVNTSDIVTISGVGASIVINFNGSNAKLDGSAGTLTVTGGGNPSSSVPSFYINNVSNTTINAVHATGGSWLEIYSINANGITITNSDIHDNGGAGIWIGTGSSNVLIQNNSVYRNGFNGGTASTAQIASMADIATAVGGGTTCVFTDPTGCTHYLGIDDPPVGGEVDTIRILNNDIYDAVAPYCDINTASCSGVWIWFTRHYLIDGNHVHNICATGIQTESGTRYGVIQNNNLEGAAQCGNLSEVPLWIDEGAHIVAQNNIIHDTGTRCSLFSQSYFIIWRKNQEYNCPGDGAHAGPGPGGTIGPGAPPGATNNAFVHNSVFNVSAATPNSTFGFVATRDEVDGANGFSIVGCNDCVNNNVVKNNIFSQSHNLSEFQKLESNDFTSNYNIWYNSARALNFRSGMGIGSPILDYTFTNYKSTFGEEQSSINQDPLFANPTAGNFNLATGSPAIDAGTFLTTINSTSGSGSTIIVADARYFTDGFGMVRGDQVTTSAGQTAYVNTVNYSTNTLTLDRSITWTLNDGIGYVYVGTRPDIGAIEGNQGGTGPATSWTASDNFDIYTINSPLGSLNSGQAWVTPWTDNFVPAHNGMTIGTKSGMSGNAVISDGTVDAFFYRTFAQINAGTGYIQMAAGATMGMADRCEVNFYAAGTSRLGSIRFLNGNIDIETNAGYTNITTYTANTVYTINFQFDTAGNPNKYRAQVNGGGFTAYLTMPNNYTVIDTIGMRNATSGTSCYWDSIGPNAPTGGGGTPPTIVNVNPNSGKLGQTLGIIINGTALDGGNATVNISGTGVTASNTRVISATQLSTTFTISAGADIGVHTVSVTTAGGTSGNINFTVNALAALSSIAPISGAQGLNVPVTLTGTNLTSSSSCVVNVSGFGITIAAHACVNATTVTATFNIASTAAAVAYNVSATIDGVTTNSVLFNVADATSPVPGSFGLAGITSQSVVLNWSAATDDTTAQGSLQYEVCQSTVNNLTTVSACELSLVQGFLTNVLTYQASGLNPGTTYYFNVVVKDVAGNKAIYPIFLANTLPAPLPPSATTIVGAPVLAKSWDLSTRVGLTSTAFNEANRGLAAHLFTWSPQSGVLTNCTLAFQTSIDNTPSSVWATQGTVDCTTSGQSAYLTFTSNYIRVKATVFIPGTSVSPVLTVNINSFYAAPPNIPTGVSKQIIVRDPTDAGTCTITAVNGNVSSTTCPVQ